MALLPLLLFVFMGGDSSVHKNPERKACVICKGLFAMAWLLSRVRHGLRGTLVLRLKKAESAAAHQRCTSAASYSRGRCPAF